MRKVIVYLNGELVGSFYTSETEHHLITDECNLEYGVGNWDNYTVDRLKN
jgi:hypothetical protein